MRTPCQGCGKRRQGCHADCPKYYEYRAKITEMNRKRNRDRDIDGVLSRRIDYFQRAKHREEK